MTPVTEPACEFGPAAVCQSNIAKDIPAANAASKLAQLNFDTILSID
jgi:hypothetical protein